MCIIISTRLDNPVECRSPHVSLPANNRSNCVLRRFMGPSVGRLLPLTCAVNVGGKEAARHAAVPSLPHFLINFHAPLRLQRIPFLPRPAAVTSAFHFFHHPFISISRCSPSPTSRSPQWPTYSRMLGSSLSTMVRASMWYTPMISRRSKGT